MRVPINEALIFIDKLFVIKLYKDFGNGPHHLVIRGAVFAHGETFARPITRRTKPLQLIDNQPARLFLPGPNPFQKGITAHLAARRLLAFGELTLDHHLRCNTGVIGPWLPEHVFAPHAFKPAENVL